MTRFTNLRALFFSAALVALPFAAHAGSLEVGPTMVQMIGKERTATVTVRNVAAEPANIQIRVADWSQVDGKDTLAPSTRLQVSPPFVKLDSGESQVIRLVLGEGSPSDESAFRLILDEVPDIQAKDGQSIRTTIEMLIPVFLTASVQSQPQLSWKAVKTTDGLRIVARNDGATRERLMNVAFTQDGKPVGDPTEGYVLSHSERSWLLPATTATALEVSADGSIGPVKAHVAIGQ
jgi:fimbrial chaperone protein